MNRRKRHWQRQAKTRRKRDDLVLGERLERAVELGLASEVRVYFDPSRVVKRADSTEQSG